ncbi:MAG: 2,3-bisphosphoglycerate-independent phosphoglycerate mutase [Alphaproteobacteria bacterium]|nr:2,3-bisphosphoglycerate-independent phosphoglycerate mutase [Alphaproteobacteria bacterium]
MEKSAKPRPVLLCVLDGWGERKEPEDNAIVLADTPVWDRLSAACPRARLDASEGHVGLPAGQMGNSEVGHMNLGAGRVVMQDLPRIDDAFAQGSIPALPAFAEFAAALRKSGGTAHLLGLLSPGGVHSHQAHIAGLARLLAEAGIPCVVHALLDGRDTPPSSAVEYMRTFLRDAPGARVATVTGRYFAMDRDKRWNRVEKAYRALVFADGAAATDPLQAIEASYAARVTDEFMLPAVIGGYRGMRDGDGLLMANFRADRAREILTALLDPAFDGFDRGRPVAFAAALGMVEYSEALNRFMKALFPAQRLDNVLGQVLADAGRTQLRIAETEKYAHVTFFFNGGAEAVFPGEERILIPSPKVATYDLKPEMSAAEVTDRLVEAIGSGRFDFILVNFANTDMVGHTGDLDAAIKAVEAVDACLGRLDKALRAAGGVMLITADHGNAEQMTDKSTGQPHTAHTTNLVPLVLAGGRSGVARLANGKLADIAPTVLDLLAIEQPAEMTGRSLIVHAGEQREAG